MISKYDAFIFDLDGTIYRGEDIILNADKTINTLKKLDKKLLFISNKTTGTVNDLLHFFKIFRPEYRKIRNTEFNHSFKKLSNR